MLESPLLDKVLDQAFSLAAVSFEAALKQMQLLFSFTGGKLEVIVAGVAGLLTFILTLMVFTNRRPRNEVLQGWPSEGSGLSKISELPSHLTVMSRKFEATQRVEKERLELIDQLTGAPQKKFSEAWRAVYSVTKVAGNSLISLTAELTALIDRALSHVQAWVSSFSTARTKPQCTCSCDWQRVAREGWMDDALSWVGWYPWQCQHCLTCSYFRRRG